MRRLLVGDACNGVHEVLALDLGLPAYRADSTP
jgi:hypothetical protein